MKKLSEIYQELGIDFTFPIEIKNADGYHTYYENSDGFWRKYEYDVNGYQTYFENSEGVWWKAEYDARGNETYYKDSQGSWEYDANGKLTYFMK